MPTAISQLSLKEDIPRVRSRSGRMIGKQRRWIEKQLAANDPSAMKASIETREVWGQRKRLHESEAQEDNGVAFLGGLCATLPNLQKRSPPQQTSKSHGVHIVRQRIAHLANSSGSTNYQATGRRPVREEGAAAAGGFGGGDRSRGAALCQPGAGDGGSVSPKPVEQRGAQKQLAVGRGGGLRDAVSLFSTRLGAGRGTPARLSQARARRGSWPTPGMEPITSCAPLLNQRGRLTSWP